MPEEADAVYDACLLGERPDRTRVSCTSEQDSCRYILLSQERERVEQHIVPFHRIQTG